MSHANENRRFGWIMAAACLAVSAIRTWRAGHVASVFAGFALMFFVLALVLPSSLERPRRIWLAFGHAMNRITQPLILGFVYFLVLTPFGFVRRLLGRSKIRLHPPAESAWQNLDEKPITDENLKRQFS